MTVNLMMSFVSLSELLLSYTGYLNMLTETFEMTFEINDKSRGARKNITLPSPTSWAALQDKVAEILNVHTGSLQLQYRSQTKKSTHSHSISAHTLTTMRCAINYDCILSPES